MSFTVSPTLTVPLSGVSSPAHRRRTRRHGHGHRHRHGHRQHRQPGSEGVGAAQVTTRSAR
eukprot:1939610-Rhodomonas_salina.2